MEYIVSGEVSVGTVPVAVNEVTKQWHLTPNILLFPKTLCLKAALFFLAATNLNSQMPSHHHHHHHNTMTNQHSCCHGCSCCCCSNSSNSFSPSPPLPTSDQLLQALTTQLLLHSQQTPQYHLYTHNSLKPQHHQNPKEDSNNHHHHQQTHSLLHSLLRRVSTLESSLSPPPTPPPKPKPSRSSLSLRDLAARTIQSRFRLFLVRRSQTLRHLQRLATIKSHAALLKSALSGETPPRILSQRATDLLSQLDSIQSGDPMIREGKRSVGRELARISEFIDKILVKEHPENGFDGVLYAKSGKRVSFAENGKEPRVLTDSPERNSDIGFYHLDDGEESPNVSEGGGRDWYGIGRGFQGQNGDLGLSAPLPVQMEPRRNGSKKKVVIE